MKLTWLGHACFKLETEVSGQGNYSMVLDPYTGVRGYEELSVEANQAIASHGHYDHNYFEAVTIKPWAGEIPVKITKIPSFHDEVQGAKRGTNTIHLIEIEGLKVVHMGDLGHILNAEQAKAIAGCDVMMIPVGGFYTIDGKTAFEVVKQVKPRVIVPMHFRDDDKGLDVVDGVEDFVKYFDPERVKYYHDGMIEVNEETMHHVAVLR